MKFPIGSLHIYRVSNNWPKKERERDVMLGVCIKIIKYRCDGAPAGMDNGVNTAAEVEDGGGAAGGD